MKERDIVRKIIKSLSARPGTIVFKLHGGAYQNAGLPDLLVIRKARATFFEVKKPGKPATLLQEVMLTKLRKHGCVAEIVHSPGEAVGIMKMMA